MAGNSGGNQGSNRGFAPMDDEKQRETARTGGEASSQKQKRDDQGQFTGSGNQGSGGQASGNQGGNR